MSAVLQEKVRPAPRNKNARNETDHTRLSVLEALWHEVIPNLATKRDLSELRSTDIAELRNDVTAIRTLQEAHLRMTQEMKSDYDRLNASLNDIHEIQGKASYDIRMLDAKIDGQGRSLNVKIDEQGRSLTAKIDGVEQRLESKISAAGDKIIIRLGGLFIVILGAIEVASRLWPKV